MLYYGYWRSSAAWRCRIAFNLKKIAPEFVAVHLTRDGGAQRTEEFRVINPQKRVPALDLNGAVLTQSLAIIEWLEETIPEPALLPDDPWSRAQVRAFALAIACDIHPLQNLEVQQYLRGKLNLEQSAVSDWLGHWIGNGLLACEALLGSQPSNQAFAFGASPTLADICLAPQLYSAERFGISLNDMPRLRTLGASYADHPAFVDAHAHNQPDSEEWFWGI
ncbi:maleylacetoacetate isomerase (plasmid) [Rhizorhabdus wittichii RW1]|uniref:Maleylacetoacetate isomerase n=1 Tax=Rhizorhabdus wittichii (strain DSM 6014 / CCUG 31198 / JCM 15750 / NBRC 105917 / EY 4224 / RW1) TaxID=392499 RepID=A0A9J9HH39_RHIWR|nr:maleylacetoacetate isomerase [Rhizorhabdus wittichii RW1]CAA73584.1 unnamed protein product [Sphingomonas sp.]